MNNKIASYSLMYFAFLIYSFSTIFSKYASLEGFLSKEYCFFFFGIIVIMGLYAVLWQQVLKKVDLSVAVANKPIALIFTLFWAVFIFKESLSLKTILGIAIVVIGLLVIYCDKNNV